MEPPVLPRRSRSRSREHRQPHDESAALAAAGPQKKKKRRHRTEAFKLQQQQQQQSQVTEAVAAVDLRTASAETLEHGTYGRFGPQKWTLQATRQQHDGAAYPSATDAPPTMVSATSLHRLRRTMVTSLERAALSRDEAAKTARHHTMETLSTVPTTPQAVTQHPTDVVGRSQADDDNIIAEAMWHVITDLSQRIDANGFWDIERNHLRLLPPPEGAAAVVEWGGDPAGVYTRVPGTVRRLDHPSTAQPIGATVNGAFTENTFANVYTEIVSSTHAAASLVAWHGAPWRMCAAGNVCKFRMFCLREVGAGWRPEGAGRDFVNPPIFPAVEFLPERTHREVSAAHDRGRTYAYGQQQEEVPGFCLLCITFLHDRLYHEARARGSDSPPRRTFNTVRVETNTGVGSYRAAAVIPAEEGMRFGLLGDVRAYNETDYVLSVRVVRPPGSTASKQVFQLLERTELLFNVATAAVPLPTAPMQRSRATSAVVIRIPSADVLTVAYWRGRNRVHVPLQLVEWVARPISELAADMALALYKRGLEAPLPVGFLPPADGDQPPATDLPMTDAAYESAELEDLLQHCDHVSEDNLLARELEGAGGDDGGDDDYVNEDYGVTAVDEAAGDAMPIAEAAPAAAPAAVPARSSGGRRKPAPGPPPVRELLPAQLTEFYATHGLERQLDCEWIRRRLPLLRRVVSGIRSCADAIPYAGLLSCALRVAILEHLDAKNHTAAEDVRQVTYGTARAARKQFAWYVEHIAEGRPVDDASVLGLSPPWLSRAPAILVPEGLEVGPVRIPRQLHHCIQQDMYVARDESVPRMCARFCCHYGAITGADEAAAVILPEFHDIVRGYLRCREYADLVDGIASRHAGAWSFHHLDGGGPGESRNIARAVQVCISARVSTVEAALLTFSSSGGGSGLLQVLADLGDPQSQALGTVAQGRLATVRYRDAHVRCIIAVMNAQADMSTKGSPEPRTPPLRGGDSEPAVESTGGILDTLPSEDCVWYPFQTLAVWHGDLPDISAGLRAAGLINANSSGQFTMTKKVGSRRAAVTRVWVGERKAANSMRLVAKQFRFSSKVLATPKQGKKRPPKKAAPAPAPVAAQPQQQQEAAAGGKKKRNTRKKRPALQPLWGDEEVPVPGPRDDRGWLVWGGGAEWQLQPLVPILHHLLPRAACSPKAYRTQMNTLATVVNNALSDRSNHAVQTFVRVAVLTALTGTYEDSRYVPRLEHRLAIACALEGAMGHTQVLEFVRAHPITTIACLWKALAEALHTSAGLLAALQASKAGDMITAFVRNATACMEIVGRGVAAEVRWQDLECSLQGHICAHPGTDLAPPLLPALGMSRLECIRRVRTLASSRRKARYGGGKAAIPKELSVARYVRTAEWHSARLLISAAPAGYLPPGRLLAALMRLGTAAWPKAGTEPGAYISPEERIRQACAAYDAVLQCSERLVPMAVAVEMLAALPDGAYQSADSLLKLLVLQGTTATTFISDSPTLAAQRLARQRMFHGMQQSGMRAVQENAVSAASCATTDLLATRILPVVEGMTVRPCCAMVAAQLHVDMGGRTTHTGHGNRDVGYDMRSGEHGCQRDKQFEKKQQANANQISAINAAGGVDASKQVLSRSTKIACGDVFPTVMPMLGRIAHFDRWVHCYKGKGMGGVSVTTTSCCGVPSLVAGCIFSATGIECDACTLPLRRRGPAKKIVRRLSTIGAEQTNGNPLRKCANPNCGKWTDMFEEGVMMMDSPLPVGAAGGRCALPETWAMQPIYFCNNNTTSCHSTIAVAFLFSDAVAPNALRHVAISSQWLSTYSGTKMSLCKQQVSDREAARRAKFRPRKGGAWADMAPHSNGYTWVRKNAG